MAGRQFSQLPTEHAKGIDLMKAVFWEAAWGVLMVSVWTLTSCRQALWLHAQSVCSRQAAVERYHWRLLAQHPRLESYWPGCLGLAPHQGMGWMCLRPAVQALLWHVGSACWLARWSQAGKGYSLFEMSWAAKIEDLLSGNPAWISSCRWSLQKASE